MAKRARVLNRATGALRAMLALVLALMTTTHLPEPSHGRQEPSEDGLAHVRIVHGLSAAGPLDVYVDGSIALIGMEFGETSSELSLPSGEHELAVSPSGAPPDAALVSGTIALESGARLYAPLIGTSDAASVGLFTIDDRPIGQARARFRVISGIPDAEGIAAAFTGGDALTPALGFGDASEYALLDAGAYDLDILDAISGAELLTLAATVLAEGTTNDIILVGQVGDGSLAAIVETTAVETTRPVGRLAQIVAGTCADRTALVADLGLVRAGQGATVGVASGPPVAQGYGLAAVSFNVLVAAPHSVTVSDDEGTDGALVACGEIGGQLTDTGSLVVSLQGDGASGVAVLAPGFENPDTTGVSVFLSTVATAGAALPEATPNTTSG